MESLIENLNVSALHFASQNGFDKIVKLLLSRDEIDVNLKTVLIYFFLM